VTLALGLDLLLFVIGLPLQVAAAYLALATLLSGKLPESQPAALQRRFQFVVPAHNESAGIQATVESLLAVDYPRDLFEVVVVADNCQDDTASKAQAAGASVLVRNDTQNRGKGYALHHAFAATEATVDAVVVIDADTLVSPNILRAFSWQRERGAQAIQADYAVRNPTASWRTRLIAIAFGSFHIVRSRARERLGLSCGLRGNGMCFSTALLRQVPHQAFSVVEDVEYGLRLGEAGHRVYYADSAHVFGEMVSSAAASSSQRRRWEEGRKLLVRQHGLRLLKAGFTRRSGLLIDLALDLLVPPLSRIATGALLGCLLALGLAMTSKNAGIALGAYGFCVASVVAYVLRGWMLSRTGLRGLLDLGLSPVYVVWKLSLRFRRPANASTDWVRTKREAPKAEASSDPSQP